MFDGGEHCVYGVKFGQWGVHLCSFLPFGMRPVLYAEGRKEGGKGAALVGYGVARGDDGRGACGGIAGGGDFDGAAACARRSSGGGFAGQKALRGFLDRRYGPVAHQEKRSCGCHFSIHRVESFCLQY